MTRQSHTVYAVVNNTLIDLLGGEMCDEMQVEMFDSEVISAIWKSYD